MKGSMLMLLLVVLVKVSHVAGGFYEGNAGVESLSAANFDSLVYGSEHPWLIEFYAPWCGHCQRLVPEFEKAAGNLKGLVRLGAVDCDDKSNQPLCGRFSIQGFPTLKIFPGSVNEKNGKFAKKERDYQGARTARSMVDACLPEIPNFSVKLGKGAKNKALENFLAASELSKALLFTSKTQTTPLFKALSVDYRNRMDLAEVLEKEKEIVEKYGVTKFPTLVVLPKGDLENPVTYDGPLQHAKLTSFLDQYAEPKKQGKGKDKGKDKGTTTQEQPVEKFDPEIIKLENQKQFKELCLNRPVGMCLLAFMVLEPEFEESVKEHQAQLEVLKAVKKTVFEKKMPYPVFWVDALTERKLLDKFNLSDQFPSLVLFSPTKKVFRPFTNGFEEGEIIRFLQETSQAKGRHYQYDFEPTLSVE